MYTSVKQTAAAITLGVLTITGVACQQAQEAAPAEETRPVVPANMSEEGWVALFDGTNLDGWRGYRSDAVPAGWVVQDGTLHFTGDGGGDIVSKEQFGDFELVLEWKISEGGNSGVFYRATEEYDNVWQSAPELQVLDDDKHPDGQIPTHTAGANYDLIVPAAKATRPVGEWNEVRLVVDSSHVEHWLNGQKIVEYELWSPEWKEMVAKSKFNEYPGYGMSPRGHIVLQDHGDPVWYRNIRLRPL